MVQFAEIVEALADRERCVLRSLTRASAPLSMALFSERHVDEDVQTRDRRVEHALRDYGVCAQTLHPCNFDHQLIGTNDGGVEGVSDEIQALARRVQAGELSIDELARSRRRIAWLCHPDRQIATTVVLDVKMKEANALIDAAIAERKAKGR